MIQNGKSCHLAQQQNVGVGQSWLALSVRYRLKPATSLPTALPKWQEAAALQGRSRSCYGIHGRLGSMATWKLTLEYKGTKYQGWQEQAKGKTIQGELRRVAEEFFQERVDLGGSGRTDAGVHALAQVAHLRASRRKPERILMQELNDRLPADILILRVEPAPERFHARHSAVSRYYLYQISTRKSAFAKDYIWWIKRPLDFPRLEECLHLFAGRHDFASFSEKPEEQGSTLVQVEEIQAARQEEMILVRIGASHFLWKMVRRVIGVAVQAGLGELEISTVRQFLKDRTSQTGQWTAPASGLFLEKVLYPGDKPPELLRPAIPVFSIP
jgi:tRNA pseudouridine38-40 synthase